MRPVTRSAWPQDANGNQKQFSDSNYKGFFSDLLDNFGFYCSYCEKCDHLDVEHVIPKAAPAGADLVVDWNNLLLGCPACNRDYKKNKNQGRTGYIWPDEVDSFRFYEYLSSGDLRVISTLSQADKDKAQATINLCGLAPKPKSQATENKDFLWLKRSQVWTIAENFKSKYSEGTETAQSISEMAFTFGFWSVWITVFDGVDEVVNAISDRFNGTKADYCTAP